MRFGELLVSRGAITEDQLSRALALQKDNPERKIGEILVTIGAIDVTALFTYLEEFYGGGSDQVELGDWLSQDGIDKLIQSLDHG